MKKNEKSYILSKKIYFWNFYFYNFLIVKINFFKAAVFLFSTITINTNI